MTKDLIQLLFGKSTKLFQHQMEANQTCRTCRVCIDHSDDICHTCLALCYQSHCCSTLEEFKASLVRLRTLFQYLTYWNVEVHENSLSLLEKSEGLIGLKKKENSFKKRNFFSSAIVDHCCRSCSFNNFLCSLNEKWPLQHTTLDENYRHLKKIRKILP